MLWLPDSVLFGCRGLETAGRAKPTPEGRRTDLFAVIYPPPCILLERLDPCQLRVCR
jgi:hypothetical protein